LLPDGPLEEKQEGAEKFVSSSSSGPGSGGRLDRWNRPPSTYARRSAGDLDGIFSRHRTGFVAYL